MKRATPKRRRTIEIYFVLYIAALVMLLPSKNTNNSHTATKLWDDLFKQSFTLHPEKSVLNCRLIADSTGNRIVSLDSSNLIIYSGNVKDVQYEFTVEDQSLRQKLTLVSNQPPISRSFLLFPSSEQNGIEFRWHPPEHNRMNRSFVVHVKATASPQPLLPNDSIQRMIDAAGARITAEAQFSVNIIFENSGAFSSQPIASLPGFREVPANGLSQTPNNGNVQPVFSGKLGEFSLKPQQSTVKSLAYQQWTNSVFLSGISRSELNLPSIRIEPAKSNGGTASISEMRENEIVLAGTSPDAGTMKVIITAERIADKKEVTVDFTIQPQQIQAPDIERTMYPGITYFILPKLPILTNTEVRALLRDGKTERVSSQGEQFTFTPDISDTQKILTFERKVGSNLVGQSIAIHVVPFPPPEILIDQITYQGGVVLVRTRSYGYNNLKANDTRLEVVDGNAAAPKDMRGNRQTDNKTLAIIQTFKIVPATTNKPFKFRIRAVDERGKSSAVKEITGE